MPKQIAVDYLHLYNAAPSNVYNCRCTLIADVEGVDMSGAKRRARDPETGESVLIENMTYAQWENIKRREGDLQQ